MNTRRAAQLLEANEQLVLAVIRAQDDAMRAAQALKDLARSAPLKTLTERPDGALLFDRLTQALAAAQRGGTRLGLLLVSIDNLKQINDSLGHARGHQALALAHQRLTAAVRGADAVSRHGGHEFLILLAAVSHASDALAVADTILGAMAPPAQLGTENVRLRVSIGVSVYPDDGDDGDALIDRATAAMYSARRRGLGSHFFRGEAPTNARSLELRLAESLQEPTERAPLDTAARDVVSRQMEANEQLLLAALRAHEMLQAAEEAQQRQTQLMGVVAHELRGPLGPISYATALLGMVKSEEPVLLTVRGVIDRQVANMTRLVADLLDVTRIAAGKLKLDVQRLDLARVVQESADDLGPAVRLRLQELRVELPPGGVMVNGDQLRLAQIVGNLLTNASKYTQDGGLIVIHLAPAGGRVRLSVTDNGIGISSSALSHVFDAFVQEEHAASFDSTGLGIGLSLVRELVQAHGGEVSAESEGLGRGSRFTVTLPELGAANDSLPGGLS